MTNTLAHTSHQLSAAAADARHPAGFSHVGVLNGPSSTPPLPSDRKPSWALHLGSLAKKPGEKCGLVIFAREPVPGRVKTRLAAGVGPESSAEIYAMLLEHTLRTAGRSDADVMISLAMDPNASWADTLEFPFEIQGRGDLGERMAECFGRRFSEGAERTVIIGSDNAHLRHDHIRSAFSALEDHPVVLGPADDGGYWLVGQRAPGIDLFTGVPWSSPDTLDATRSSLQKLDVEWHELETLPDIDTEEDLRMALEDPRVDKELRRQLNAVLVGFE